MDQNFLKVARVRTSMDRYMLHVGQGSKNIEWIIAVTKVKVGGQVIKQKLKLGGHTILRSR